MYNTDMPTRAELPTSGQLIRSTLIAAGVAAALLVTVVLPAEYGIDPTGVGRALGLAEMGEIKTQLHQEAEADAATGRTAPAPAAPGSPAPEQRSGLLRTIFAELVIGSAAAQTAPAAKNQEITISLAPGQGSEVKADMRKGAKLTYAWIVEGGTVNHDTHGDGGGSSESYSKGRSVAGDKGDLVAAFDGNHGWFWRNRANAPVTLTLRTSGDYKELKRVL